MRGMATATNWGRLVSERRFDQGYPSLDPRSGLVGLSTGSQRRQAPDRLLSPLMRPAHQCPLLAPRTPQHVGAAKIRGNPWKREGRDRFWQRGIGGTPPITCGWPPQKHRNGVVLCLRADSTCGDSTGCPCFSTSRPVFYICTIFAFRPLSSSFLIDLRGRERGIRRNGPNNHFHSLGMTYQTVTTGWARHPQVFRGCFFRQIPRPAWVCGRLAGHPQVFGGKCATPCFCSLEGGL